MRNQRNDAGGGTRTADPPLTTRSIVLSLLLGSHPPQMPVAALVEFCGLFGIAGGTVRTSLSRMVERRELSVEGAVYRLSGGLLDRQAEQDTGRTRADIEWDSAWHIVIVSAERRSVAERRTFRSRARGAKLGELRADLWMRPANLEIPAKLAGVVVSRGALVQGDDREVARSLWDVTSIDRLSDTLTSGLADAEHQLSAIGPAALASTFVTLARALRHLRVEPQLPAEVHSPASGDALRSAYRDVERTFRAELQTFLGDR